jgi:hypothetical protein
MPKPKVTAAIFVLLIATAFAYGRTTEGVLGGIVLNSKGAPVAAAQVFWQTADGKTPHAVRTDAKGHFRIAGLREGLYDLRAQASGMSSEWRHNIFVRGGSAAGLTLRLSRPTSRPATAPRPKR